MSEPDYHFFRRMIAALEPLSDADLSVLLRAAKLQKLPARSVLAVEGTPAARAFLLLKGRVRLSRAHDHGIPSVLADMGPGNVVGAIGLLDNGDYMNSAEAASEVMALVVDRSKLYALGAAGEAAVFRIIRALGPSVVEAVRRSAGRVQALFADPEAGVREMERVVLASARRERS